MARGCMGPSFDDAFLVPKALSKAQLVVVAFVEVTKRTVKARTDAVEIHNAYGYLLFSFLGPISNHLTLKVIDVICDVHP
jgi:2,4-dienoyl-CoA reductase-like NADH-dependent reductase (Old Yellow Enzyme family)